jgi:hypothetical protein
MMGSVEYRCIVHLKVVVSYDGEESEVDECNNDMNEEDLVD